MADNTILLPDVITIISHRLLKLTVVLLSRSLSVRAESMLIGLAMIIQTYHAGCSRNPWSNSMEQTF